MTAAQWFTVVCGCVSFAIALVGVVFGDTSDRAIALVVATTAALVVWGAL